jgi:chromosome segregation ATPase
VQKSFQEALDADALFYKTEADHSICTKYQTFHGCASIKDAQTAAKHAERERSRIEKSYDKDADREIAANDSLGGMISEFKEHIGSLADALYALDDRTLQRDVKMVQQGLKTSVRTLATAFQTVKAACESRSKISTLYRKATKASCLATAAYREAQARLAASAEEHNHATKELASCKEKLSLCETRLEEAKSAHAVAEEQLSGQKRKRDEDKAALSDLKQSLKALRTGEKDATSGRECLYKSYAKTDKGVKEELKAAKASAQAYADEQHKEIEAIQALKNEAYDPNPVQEAYESKTRPQQEDDV